MERDEVIALKHSIDQLLKYMYSDECVDWLSFGDLSEYIMKNLIDIWQFLMKHNTERNNKELKDTLLNSIATIMDSRKAFIVCCNAIARCETYEHKRTKACHFNYIRCKNVGLNENRHRCWLHNAITKEKAAYTGTLRCGWLKKRKSLKSDIIIYNPGTKSYETIKSGDGIFVGNYGFQKKDF